MFPSASGDTGHVVILCTASRDKIVVWHLDTLASSPTRAQCPPLSNGVVACDGHNETVTGLSFNVSSRWFVATFENRHLTVFAATSLERQQVQQGRRRRSRAKTAESRRSSADANVPTAQQMWAPISKMSCGVGIADAAPLFSSVKSPSCSPGVSDLCMRRKFVVVSLDGSCRICTTPCCTSAPDTVETSPTLVVRKFTQLPFSCVRSCSRNATNSVIATDQNTGLLSADFVAGTCDGKIAFFLMCSPAASASAATAASIRLVTLIDVAASFLPAPAHGGTGVDGGNEAEKYNHGWSSDDDDSEVEMPEWAVAASTPTRPKLRVPTSLHIATMDFAGDLCFVGIICPPETTQEVLLLKKVSGCLHVGVRNQLSPTVSVPLVMLEGDTPASKKDSLCAERILEPVLRVARWVALQLNVNDAGATKDLRFPRSSSSNPSCAKSPAVAYVLRGEPDVRLQSLFVEAVEADTLVSNKSSEATVKANRPRMRGITPIDATIKHAQRTSVQLPGDAHSTTTQAYSQVEHASARCFSPTIDEEGTSAERASCIEVADAEFVLDPSLEAATAGRYVATVFPEAPAPEGSVLYVKKLSPRKLLERKRAKARAVAAANKKHASGRAKAVVNRPIVFHHSRIKSSGYGKAVPFLKGGPMPKKIKQQARSQQAGSASNGVLAKALSRKYPVTCRLLTSFQPQHALPPPGVHGAAIKMCEYSPCGSYLATAAVDQTARILRLPVQRHRGSGHTLLAHKAPVPSVAWSSDSKYMLTAGDDRQVCLWSIDRGGSDPLFSLRHLEGLPSLSVTSNGLPDTPGRTPSQKSESIMKNHSYRPQHRRLSSAPATSGSKSTSTMSVFPNDVRRAIFTYSDQFIVIPVGNNLCVYAYGAQQYRSKNELDNLRRRSLCKLVRCWRTPSTQSIVDITTNNGVLSPLVLASNSNRSVTIWDLAVEKPALTIPHAHSRAASRITLPQVS